MWNMSSQGGAPCNIKSQLERRRPLVTHCRDGLNSKLSECMPFSNEHPIVSLSIKQESMQLKLYHPRNLTMVNGV